MQLGGFGGMDYTLRSSNPVSRPLEFGIAKVGLSLPEIPRQEIPTFSKVSYRSIIAINITIDDFNTIILSSLIQLIRQGIMNSIWTISLPP